MEEEGTAAGRQVPDADPAASSMPKIRRPATEEMSSAIGAMTRVAQDRATRHALLLVARALERRQKVEVISTIGGILAGLPIAEVLAALEDLARSRAAEGERS
jgi:hypothetical protein